MEFTIVVCAGWVSYEGIKVNAANRQEAEAMALPLIAERERWENAPGTGSARVFGELNYKMSIVRPHALPA